MNTSKIIGIALIIISLLIGYTGFTKITDNSTSISLLGVKIDASNESGKQQGYLFLGLAIIVFAGGIYTMNRAKS